MGIRGRRRAGVNFISVMRATRRLTQDPDFEPVSQKEMCQLVLEEVMNKSLPQAQAEMPEIDWEAILAFIMKILPLILMFL